MTTPDLVGGAKTSAHGGMILLVAESTIADPASHHLIRAGYRVEVSTSLATALKIAEQEPPSLVVVDWALPTAAPEAWLRSLRHFPQTQQAALVLLLTNQEVPDSMVRLTHRVDLTLPRSVTPGTLARSVSQLLSQKLQLRGQPEIYHLAELTFNRITGEVVVDGRISHLSALERQLILALLQQPGRILSRASLNLVLWEAPLPEGSRALDVHLRRLRSKLGRAGDLIETVRGRGLRWMGTSKR